MLPERLQTLLQSELQPHERILWSGQPDPSRMARKNIVPFLVGLGFFTLPTIALVSSLNKGEFDVFSADVIAAALFFAVFGAIGLLTMFSPLWAWRIARKTIYAITSSRVLILKVKPFTSAYDVIVHDRADLYSVSRKQRANGSGDLLLDGHQGANIIDNHSFIGIPDVRNVERILTTMRDENLHAQNPNATP